MENNTSPAEQPAKKTAEAAATPNPWQRSPKPPTAKELGMSK